MTVPPTLLLMGLRASGKSTVARRLARTLRVPAIDLDDAVRDHFLGATVRDIWATHGEPAFRLAETEALRAILAERIVSPRIVALGGGTPTAPGAADALRDATQRKAAMLVYLHAPPEHLAARLTAAETANRPSLTGAGAAEEVARVYAERDPLYRELASAIVEVDRPIDEVVNEIRKLWPAASGGA
jgi:shikimate kinase